MNTDAHSLEFHLADEEATSELGARLARALDSVKSEILEKGLNIKLVGDLGAGKTYLMRSALRALGFEGRVKSPTFSLLETYKVDGFTVNHFDFYRFEDPVEFEEAGFRENYGPGRVVASEWTSKAEPFVPQPDLTITLKNLEGAGGALLLSFVPWSTAYGAQVVDVRVWPAEEYTRITIEHDAPMKFKYFVLRNSDPVRLAVDIDGLLLTDKLKQIIQKVKPNDPYISRIRVGQNRPNVVRISIDFKTDVDPQVFSLKPAGQYRYRLVFDIYPATQKDPLMAIIQKEESEPDAIKSLLAQVAEGQKRMEENRADSGEVDQLGQILAGIADGSLAPMRPDEEPKGSSKPAQKKPAQKKPETQLAQTKPSKTKPARSPRVRTLVIMIDPGHGGEDPGAIGRRHRTREKDVVLAVARILRQELNEIEGVKALLTRDGDYFVPLQRRVQKARAAKADFFVSIHADAWVKPTARGSSLYVLNTRGQVSTANRWLARKQNDADLIGGVNLSNKDKQIARILMDMSMTSQVSDSMVYGARILNELSRINQLHRGKVEQANFAVLKAPDIPSVLVETAFLSHPEEEKKLRTRAFQRKLACAIGNGILKGFGHKSRLG